MNRFGILIVRQTSLLRQNNYSDPIGMRETQATRATRATRVTLATLVTVVIVAVVVAAAVVVGVVVVDPACATLSNATCSWQ